MSESGDMGVSEGYVKVPSRDEYQPPKSFREDIIEALKEKFPKAYQELLNEYYKRLIK